MRYDTIRYDRYDTIRYGEPITDADSPPLPPPHPHQESLFPSACVLPGVVRLVGHLKRHGVPMAVATSSHRHAYHRKTQRHHELFQLFDHVVTGDDPQVGRWCGGQWGLSGAGGVESSRVGWSRVILLHVHHVHLHFALATRPVRGKPHPDIFQGRQGSSSSAPWSSSSSFPGPPTIVTQWPPNGSAATCTLMRVRMVRTPPRGAWCSRMHRPVCRQRARPACTCAGYRIRALTATASKPTRSLAHWRSSIRSGGDCPRSHRDISKFTMLCCCSSKWCALCLSGCLAAPSHCPSPCHTHTH